MPPGTDYYAVLGISRACSSRELQAAYRNLAIRTHPVRGGDTADFDAVTEAYEVLTDAEHKAVFDAFGEVALKEGVPDGDGGTLGGSYRYSADPQALFEAFFGVANPFEAVVAEAQYKAKGGDGLRNPAESRNVYVEVTLEELATSQPKPVQVGPRSLPLALSPRYSDGEALLFKEDGSGMGDITLVLQVAPHAAFTLVGKTLHCARTLTVLESLVGCVVELPLPDGRVLKVPVNDVVAPGYTKTVPGEGMGGGDLVISFDIKFPTVLSLDQKSLLKAALGACCRCCRCRCCCSGWCCSGGCCCCMLLLLRLLLHGSWCCGC